jgi:hypothetical protein
MIDARQSLRLPSGAYSTYDSLSGQRGRFASNAGTAAASRTAPLRIDTPIEAAYFLARNHAVFVGAVARAEGTDCGKRIEERRDDS